MASYSTRVAKPVNHQDFEERTSVLFRELLNDPNLKRFGRSGQGQEGIDLLGKRDGNPKKVVGVQCKLKGEGEKLTEDEVKSHVKMALAFKPKLTEYILVTTSPDDAKLDKLAARLSQQQKSKGRRISIVVWGWETTQSRINEIHSAKNAFDPGFSPALGAIQSQLDAIVEKQKEQASSQQVANVAARLDDAQLNKLPLQFADRELQREFRKALSRRGFPATNWQEEISDLAERAISGDLSLASPKLRADIVERAARSTAVADTREKARRYEKFVRATDPQRQTPVLDALLVDADGDHKTALQQLRAQNSSDALGAAFILIGRDKGYGAAVQWLEAEGISPESLNPPGALNYLANCIQSGQVDHGLKVLDSLPCEFFNECPCFHYLKGNAIVASILPVDQKTNFFLAGLGINPRTLQLASDKPSRAKIKDARREYQSVLSQAEELGLGHLTEIIAEIDLWLELEDPDTADFARTKLQAELSDPSKTLRRVRLALAYQVDFNRDALQRQLKVRRETSGWTVDESFAALLMAVHQRDPAKTADLIEEFSDDLYKEEQLSQAIIAGIEIESLARAGRLDRAKVRLEQCQPYLNASQSKQLSEAIEDIEAGDESERNRRRYKETGDLVLLRVIVGEAARNQDNRQVAEFGSNPRASHEARK